MNQQDNYYPISLIQQIQNDDSIPKTYQKIPVCNMHVVEYKTNEINPDIEMIHSILINKIKFILKQHNTTLVIPTLRQTDNKLEIFFQHGKYYLNKSINEINDNAYQQIRLQKGYDEVSIKEMEERMEQLLQEWKTLYEAISIKLIQDDIVDDSEDYFHVTQQLIKKDIDMLTEVEVNFD